MEFAYKKKDWIKDILFKLTTGYPQEISSHIEYL